MTLIWRLKPQIRGEVFEAVRSRPPGLALIVILPSSDSIDRPTDLLRLVELSRPQSILPYHDPLNVMDLKVIAARPPDDLSLEISDYLVWRGLHLDIETRSLIRKIIELSDELRTVRGLARALYMSRRALGRRFLTQGLPVPSHWLHLGRILRATVRLQNGPENLFTVATSLGYPDGFALSNQMARLTGVRPTVARAHLGWEWMLEEWIQREVSANGFSDAHTRVLLASCSTSAEQGKHKKLKQKVGAKRQQGATGGKK